MKTKCLKTPRRKLSYFTSDAARVHAWVSCQATEPSAFLGTSTSSWYFFLWVFLHLCKVNANAGWLQPGTEHGTGLTSSKSFNFCFALYDVFLGRRLCFDGLGGVRMASAGIASAAAAASAISGRSVRAFFSREGGVTEGFRLSTCLVFLDTGSFVDAVLVAAMGVVRMAADAAAAAAASELSSFSLRERRDGATVALATAAGGPWAEAVSASAGPFPFCGGPFFFGGGRFARACDMFMYLFKKELTVAEC